MKKLIALMLALVMCLGLAACGSNGSNDNPPASNPTPDASGDAEVPGGDDGAYAGESFTIYMATDSNENADQSAPLRYFRDTVAEKSGGAVKVEVAWGGTEYDNAGIWEAMSNGLLSMDICLMNKHAADIPVMSWGFMPYSTNAGEAIEQTNYLLFENEETSAIIAKYFDDVNMTILGNTCDGAPSFITTFAWDGLDDLVAKCSAFGTMNTAKYQALGLTCTSVPAPDAYDNLSRGIVDGVSAPLGTAITNSMYEVAPYATVDGQYTASVLVLANNDFWDGLSAEAQALIQACVDDTSAYSAEYVTDSTLAAAATWEEETGNAVKFLDEEDGKTFWAQTLAAIAANSAANAAGQAYEQDMMTLLNAWIEYQEEYHGIEIDWQS